MHIRVMMVRVERLENRQEKHQPEKRGVAAKVHVTRVPGFFKQQPELHFPRRF